MILLPEILIICFLIFLYCVFVFAREDFVLLRKNVSLEHMFSLAFLTFLVGLFFARLFFVIENFSVHYLNPLMFLAFVYFPGFSLAGGMLGGLGFLWLSLKRKKMPFGRIFDIFSLSFLFTLYIGNLLIFIIDIFYKKILFVYVGLSFIFLILFMLLTYWFAKSKFRQDGTCGFLSISFIALFQIIGSLVLRGNRHLLPIQIEDILLFVIFLGMLGFFIKQEFFHSKKRS